MKTASENMIAIGKVQKIVKNTWRNEMKRLTHLSLFSGIGGLDLAAEWACSRQSRKWKEE